MKCVNSFPMMASKKRVLSEVNRAKIVALSGEGNNQVEIAKIVKCSRTGVQYTLKRFKDIGSIIKKVEEREKQLFVSTEN